MRKVILAIHYLLLQPIMRLQILQIVKPTKLFLNFISSMFLVTKN